MIIYIFLDFEISFSQPQEHYSIILRHWRWVRTPPSAVSVPVYSFVFLLLPWQAMNSWISLCAQWGDYYFVTLEPIWHKKSLLCRIQRRSIELCAYSVVATGPHTCLVICPHTIGFFFFGNWLSGLQATLAVSFWMWLSLNRMNSMTLLIWVYL